jgi:hypothetical protein
MVTARPAILNLRLNSRPGSAALVRAALGGLAAPFALRAELVNDLKINELADRAEFLTAPGSGTGV